MTKKQQSENEKQETITRLRESLPPGSTVHTILRHCSRSGMQRAISMVVDSQDVSYLVVRATGDKIDQKWGGIKIGGCGMDMGFALVYNLSRVLYSDGFGCVGKNEDKHEYCPSSDHSNRDRNYTPHGQAVFEEDGEAYIKEHWHGDGGYALKHRWL